jgi:uncharacterized protein (DUF1330 family)
MTGMLGIPNIHLQHGTTALYACRSRSRRRDAGRRPDQNSMAAYLIVDIARIHDEETYARYRSQVTAGLEAAGGRYLVRGGDVEVIEGTLRPGRLVIVRFDSIEAARQWWSSPEYEPLRKLREASTSSNMVLVQGLPRDGVRP